jgi:hypothetical protein
LEPPYLAARLRAALVLQAPVAINISLQLLIAHAGELIHALALDARRPTPGQTQPAKSGAAHCKSRSLSGPAFLNTLLESGAAGRTPVSLDPAFGLGGVQDRNWYTL